MHSKLLLVHQVIFKNPKSVSAPSFSLKKILFDAQCFHLMHPGFKNDTVLPFVHLLLLFSLRCVVLHRILFVSLRLVWFGEWLGSVKVKVPVFSVAEVGGGIRCTQCWVCVVVYRRSRGSS